MSEIKLTYTGGPAFPVPTSAVPFLGLSKREWFAGMALQGLIGSDADVDPEFVGSLGKWGDVVAKRAYHYADAMIRAGKGEK
jgi:hypothetical protein